MKWAKLLVLLVLQFCVTG